MMISRKHPIENEAQSTLRDRIGNSISVQSAGYIAACWCTAALVACGGGSDPTVATPGLATTSEAQATTPPAAITPTPVLPTPPATVTPTPVVPVSTGATPWRFAVLGDTHVPNSTLLGEMATAMMADSVKLVLFPGDIVESGRSASAETYATQLSSWKSLAAPMYQAGIGVYPIRGNHENDTNQSTVTWNSAFAGAYQLPANGPATESNLSYSIGYKNALFVGLDDYVNIHRVNQTWLDQQFAANTTRPHVFVFGHEPAFKVFHTDNLDDYVAERDQFWKSLVGAGARTYFSGHDHFFDAARIDDGDGNLENDVVQVVVGTGGGTLFDQYNYFNASANSSYTPVQLSHWMTNGYLLVEVSGETASDRLVTLTFKRRNVATDGLVSYLPAYTFSYTAAAKPVAPTSPSYAIVDTGQSLSYNASAEIAAPAVGAAFYGQDAQHQGLAPSYRDNGDGTVSDLHTGLMWVKARGSKSTWTQASAGATTSRAGSYSDWRMPTIRELYSLIQFTGAQGPSMTSTAGYIPFIDSNSFDFVYGSGSSAVGDRVIDSQDWSSNVYVGRIMSNQSAAFGVNFADGRIKGYPLTSFNYVRYVRGNASYGVNAFKDNADGTVTDQASGLMWTQADSGVGMDWQSALAWVQQRNDQAHLGHRDWRLPNAKELHSILDYARAPQATELARKGPAIDPVLHITAITDEAGGADYPFFWTSTSFKDGTRDGIPAAYMAFGRALGYMVLQGSSSYQLLDVHGAGAQRSDPKTGQVSDYLIGLDASGKPVYGRGPQGDVVRINNFVRLLRDAD